MTKLDVANQLGVLDLLTDLNQRHGTTVPMVLHDLVCPLLGRPGGGAWWSHPGGCNPSGGVDSWMISGVLGNDSQVISDPVSGLPAGDVHRRSSCDRTVMIWLPDSQSGH